MAAEAARARRLALACIVPLAGALLLAASEPSPGKPRACTAGGARWTWRAKTGDEYNVHPSGTTCVFARRWAARLSYEPLVAERGERVIRGGPDGWSCRTRFPFPFERAWAGTCSKGDRAFAWLPRLAR